jgi:hypothetical protein
MAIQQRTKNKVTAFVNIVYEKCKEGKPFEMKEITHFLKCDCTLPHHLISNAIIENGGGYGKNADCQYRWIADVPSPEMIDNLLDYIDNYRMEALVRTKEKRKQEQLMLPEPVITIPELEFEEVKTEEKIETNPRDLEALWSDVQDMKSAMGEISRLLFLINNRSISMESGIEFLTRQLL